MEVLLHHNEAVCSREEALGPEAVAIIILTIIIRIIPEGLHRLHQSEEVTEVADRCNPQVARTVGALAQEANNRDLTKADVCRREVTSSLGHNKATVTGVVVVVEVLVIKDLEVVVGSGKSILGHTSRFLIKALASHGIVLGEAAEIVEGPGKVMEVIQ